MTSKMQTGQEGERKAAEYLISKGYKILERNYRHKRAEIDLIAEKDGWLIFVEVKTRSSSYFGFPEEFVDKHKEGMIFYAADHYMYISNWEGNVRYDIISILGVEWEQEIMHFEDAFY
jgi:putative endonuclease